MPLPLPPPAPSRLVSGHRRVSARITTVPASSPCPENPVRGTTAPRQSRWRSCRQPAWQRSGTGAHIFSTSQCILNAFASTVSFPGSSENFVVWCGGFLATRGGSSSERNHRDISVRRWDPLLRCPQRPARVTMERGGPCRQLHIIVLRRVSDGPSRKPGRTSLSRRRPVAETNRRTDLAVRACPGAGAAAPRPI